MKSFLPIVGLCFVLLGNAASPAFAAESSKPVPSAKLVELKKQLAVTEAQIAALKTRKAKVDQAARDKAKDQRDSISEMSEEQTLLLQRAMEQKAQLETMISNVMKAESETSSSIPSAKKA